MAIDLAALKIELETDPLGIGYALFIADGTIREITRLINEINPAFLVPNDPVTSIDLIGAVDIDEYKALTGTGGSIKRDMWRDILQAVSAENAIDPNATGLKAQIMGIWDAGGPTRTALIALQTRLGSRAEVLFGTGTTLVNRNITDALNL